MLSLFAYLADTPENLRELLSHRSNLDLWCLDGGLNCGCCDTCDEFCELVEKWQSTIEPRWLPDGTETTLTVSRLHRLASPCGAPDHATCFEVETINAYAPQCYELQPADVLHAYVDTSGTRRVTGTRAAVESPAWLGRIKRRVTLAIRDAD